MAIELHDLKPAPGAHKSRTRVGRGEGSKGKTSGRGTKGTGARKNVPEWFEGGQMPGPGILQHIDGQIIEPMVLPSGPVLLFPRSAPQPSQSMAVGFDGVEQDTERGADAVFLRCRVPERRKVMSGRHRGVFRPGKDPGRDRQLPRRADQAKSLEMREKGAWR